MTESKTKRTAVDDAFCRLFDYEWGTEFDIDTTRADSRDKTFIQIFGLARAARILGSRGTFKKQKIFTTSLPEVNTLTSNVVLPQTGGSCDATSTVTDGVSGTRRVPVVPVPVPVVPSAVRPTSKIDNILKQLAGSSKASTVKKTSEDWENFKESDKQLQDELEKKAQGKDAYLVKQDFLVRVDNRKFEIEKEERDRERARKMANG